MNEIIIVLFGLCWGSFLNVIAYRSLHDQSFFKLRSYCPTCKINIAWYDNIPVISWLFLRGRCRNCKSTISWLYPFIEIITAFVAWVVFFRLPVDVLRVLNFNFFNQSFLDVIRLLPSELLYYQLACGLFFSALIIAVRTDLEALVIPQIFSLWLIPVWIVSAACGITPISWQQSLLGAVLGYAVLWGVAKIFTYATNKDGLGVGDMELLACIGSFTGPSGAWLSLMLASILGTLLGGTYLIITGKEKTTRIPFGPFLALGALWYVLFASYFLDFLLV